MTHQLNMLHDSRLVSHIPDGSLIRRFSIKTGNKKRNVNEPVEPLKTILKKWNSEITAYYENELMKNHVYEVAQAYLPHKSIHTNARRHRQSDIIKFDFKGFYDSCRYEYFEPHLRVLDPAINQNNTRAIKRLLIDPQTGGVTQGLPVSGALAGLTMIPFWKELQKRVSNQIKFTQYSDDLTFSYTGVTTPDDFTIPVLSQKIYESLKAVGLDFRLNDAKTRMQKDQYRQVTGVRLNHLNQTTPSRKDYRFLRHALYILSKSDDLEREIKQWGFKSKAAFSGKVSYMRSTDETGKINRLIMQYRNTCRFHQIFTKWIDEQDQASVFA